MTKRTVDALSSTDAPNPKPKKSKTPESNPYGFKPSEDPKTPDHDEELNEEEAAEREQLIGELLQMVSRYPQLKLRSSNELLERLKHFTLEQLRNVHFNASNDISELRGTPCATTVLLGTVYLDRYLPHYSDICLADVELKRDIENEVVDFFGYFGAGVNILFRLVNNAIVAKQRAAGYETSINPADQGGAPEEGEHIQNINNDKEKESTTPQERNRQ